MKLIDAESFNENFQYYDNETIRMVVENFIEESEDRLKELEKNASDLNLEKLSFNAHSLKSVIGNFMAPQPFELCRILEEKSRQKSETDYDSILIELRNMMEGLVIELKDYLKSID